MTFSLQATALRIIKAETGASDTCTLENIEYPMQCEPAVARAALRVVV
jgi:hypothetical protein